RPPSPRPDLTRLFLPPCQQRRLRAPLLSLGRPRPPGGVIASPPRISHRHANGASPSHVVEWRADLRLPIGRSKGTTEGSIQPFVAPPGTLVGSGIYGPTAM